MILESQVCSLELSKKLLTLGVKQESSFYWYQTLGEEWLLHYIDYNHHETDMKIFLAKNNEAISSFTVSELIKILPNSVLVPRSEPFSNYRMHITKFNSVDEKMVVTNDFIIKYECDSTEVTGENAWFKRKLTFNIYDPSLANALAKMLIYLIENGLMKCTTN